MFKPLLLSFSLLFILFAFAGCKKDQSYESVSTSLSDVPLQSLSKFKEEQITTASTVGSTSTSGWQNIILSFYNFSEHPNTGVVRKVADADLQTLGDMLDRNEFSAASSRYRIAADSLRMLKTRFYEAFDYWYRNVYVKPPSSTVSSNTVVKPQGWLDDPCRDIYNACNDNVNLNYFGKIGGCYTASIAVAGFTTPLGGGIFAIGCGLWAGRYRKNDLIVCSGEYRLCIRK